MRTAHWIAALAALVAAAGCTHPRLADDGHRHDAAEEHSHGAHDHDHGAAQGHGDSPEHAQMHEEHMRDPEHARMHEEHMRDPAHAEMHRRMHGGGAEGSAGHRHMHDGPQAIATLQPTRGNGASGVAVFEQHADHVRVYARVNGLAPNQEHGFHVHEKGDCASGDGMGTGGHFNPTGARHGPPGGEHHAGDMPALKADATGTAEAVIRLTGVTLGEGPANLMGRGVIVHAKPDDYKTQPAGDAGARIACGVISAD
jgi:Cu-Zn family superoxide dismutase